MENKLTANEWKRAAEKLELLRKGHKVITNDAEMDRMSALDGETMNSVRSVPNPHRVGVLDVYVAWIEA